MEKDKKQDAKKEIKELIRIEPIVKEFYADVRSLDFIKDLPDDDKNKKIKERLNTLPSYSQALFGFQERESHILIFYTTDKSLSDKIYIMHRYPYDEGAGQFVIVDYIGELTGDKLKIIDLMSSSSKAEYVLYFPPQTREEYRGIRSLEESQEPIKFFFYCDTIPGKIPKLPILGGG